MGEIKLVERYKPVLARDLYIYIYIFVGILLHIFKPYFCPILYSNYSQISLLCINLILLDVTKLSSNSSIFQILIRKQIS